MGEMTSSTPWLASDLFANHEELLDAPATSRGTLGTYLSPFYRLGRLYRSRIGSRRSLRQAAGYLQTIEAEIAAAGVIAPPPSWRVLRSAWSITDVAVFALGAPNGTPMAVVKIPYTIEGMTHLRRQRDVLQTLHGNSRLESFQALVPIVLAEGVLDHRYYLAESVQPGTELRSIDRTTDAYARGLESAVRCISRLHCESAHVRIVAERELERWVEAPLRLIEGLFALLPRSVRLEGVIEEVRRELCDAIVGQEVTTSWIHGDLWPGNVLVSTDGEIVHGIVDWGRAGLDELPMHDLLQLAMHSPRLLRSYPDLGAAVRALLRSPHWGPEELQILAASPISLPTDPTSLRRMLLLYWLRYLSTYLVKCPDKVRNQWWVRRNVADVFRGL